MAIGLPDYSRGIRPGYGAPMKVKGNKVVTALGYNTILSITGKGMTYGGLVFLSYTSTQKSGEVIVDADGSYMLTMSFYNMNLLNVNLVGIYPQVLRKYDDTNFIYCVGIASGITFEKSMEIVYNELNTTTPTVFAELMYALV